MGNLIDDNLYACPATTKRHITDQWSGIRIASSLIRIVALVIFALALSMPAARYQVDWLDGPISINVVSGWALFKLTFAILMPVTIPFCVANVFFIFASLTLPWCTSADKLFSRSFLLGMAFLLACFESVPNDRFLGHHLWAGSFLIAILAHMIMMADTLRTNMTEPSKSQMRVRRSTQISKSAMIVFFLKRASERATMIIRNSVGGIGTLQQKRLNQYRFRDTVPPNGSLRSN